MNLSGQCHLERDFTKKLAQKKDKSHKPKKATCLGNN